MKLIDTYINASDEDVVPTVFCRVVSTAVSIDAPIAGI